MLLNTIPTTSPKHSMLAVLLAASFLGGLQGVQAVTGESQLPLKKATYTAGQAIPVSCLNRTM
jgi:hypothetical protein